MVILKKLLCMKFFYAAWKVQLVLFCFVLFCFVLFCFLLFYFVTMLYCTTSFYRNHKYLVFQQINSSFYVYSPFQLWRVTML